MTRIGGVASVKSTSGEGTSIELRWVAGPPERTSTTPDPDRLIERVRIGFGLALCTYAVVNLIVTVPYSLPSSDHPGVQVFLGLISAASALTAISGIRYKRWWPAWPAAAALLGVTVCQTLLLDADLLGGQAHWAQGAIGWCMVPLLLGMPVGRGALILTGYWVLGSVTILLANRSNPAFVNVGLGTASIFSVQLYALVFSDLIRGAARDARAETDAQLRVVTRERVAQALQADYQRRYADLVDSVVPLLFTLTLGEPISTDLRHQARSETQRLRTLFDQSRSFDHPLMREIRTLVDGVELRGIDITVHVDGSLPELDEHAIRSLMDAVVDVVAGPVTSVRLVLTAAEAGVTASVVCELPPGRLAHGIMPVERDGRTVVATDSMVWLTQTA